MFDAVTQEILDLSSQYRRDPILARRIYEVMGDAHGHDVGMSYMRDYILFNENNIVPETPQVFHEPLDDEDLEDRLI